MSGSAIASVFQLGPRITAQVLGLPFSQYRPSGISTPIAAGNLITYAATTPVNTIPAWITADKTSMGSVPFAEGKPIGYAQVDPALTLPGDYLVGSLTVGGPIKNFFIMSQDVPSPIEIILCNRVISVQRLQDAGSIGLSPVYGGQLPAADTTDQASIITGWPGSVVAGMRSNPNAMQLPSDSKLGTVTILLPPSVPVSIFADDIVVDDLENSYSVFSAILSSTGWRLTADQRNEG